MMHDSRAESKEDYLACSFQPAYVESQSSLLFSSGDTLSSRLMLFGGAIHRINRSPTS